MFPISFNKICLVTLFSSTLAACGGGGGGGSDSTPPTPTPTPTNSAPTISEFSAQVSTSNPLDVEFSWSVNDTDNDALSCSLSTGSDVSAVTITDCSATTSTTVTYLQNGDYEASLTVTDTSNATASQRVDVAIVDAGLPAPAVVAGDNELVIFYNRPDESFNGWVLHLWNNDSCNAYLNGDTQWSNGMEHTGIDANYGAYWVIDLKPDHNDCANFIVHKGDEKDLGGIDQQANLTGDKMIWSLSGIPTLYEEATLFPSGVLIHDIAAHWVNAETVFWDVQANVTKVRVYSSQIDDLGYDGDTGIAGDNFIEYLPSTGQHPASLLNLPRYQSLDAFTTNQSNVEKAKDMLTGKLLAIAYDSDDNVVAATYVQSPKIIDALYTQSDDDANEMPLGIIYDNGDISANLWAPTAQQVHINTYNQSKALVEKIALSKNTDTGIWHATLDNSNDRLFYRYELTVYHPQNHRIETIETTDPYSLSLSTNGDYSQFVNLDDADLKPSGWDQHTIPTVTDNEDSVIYEGHIRDFSVLDSSTSMENRGKYLAFTETESVPVNHLKSLAESGLTHFQMLPANDIASINEDPSSIVNLEDTVEKLCQLNANAPVCGLEDNNAVLIDILNSYDPNSTDAQALVNALRGLDSFNWGYDPEHFTTPDGSYASNSDGVARILEMRAMNQSLHELGLRVVLDVVYNHTNSSGLWGNSVLDKVVPGYYHRRDLTTGSVETSTCCQDTAPEHVMMDKLMADSLVTWASAYKFDGFRFDIMSNNSTDSILNARNAVLAVDADSYFYGEGWTRADRGYVQANQQNMAGSEVGTFNDRPRDIIRSASLFNASGSLQDQDVIRLGLIGTLANYQLEDKNDNIKPGSTFSKPAYADDPADIINYVSKHDNETLWDQLQYGITSTTSVADRVRIQNIAGTLPLISQGIPFFQFGGDLIRSKSMDRNTYDAGDWFNKVDFTKTHNNWNVGLPLAQDNEQKWDTITPLINNSETAVSSNDIHFSSSIFKEVLSIRQDSKLFRLTTEADIIERIGFHNTGSSQTQGLIVMSIDDGIGLTDIDSKYDAVVVVINGTDSTQSHSIHSATAFELHSILRASADSRVQQSQFTQGASNGTFEVPALTTAIFVKPQNGAQGEGLAADATLNAPDPAPYGDTELYFQGSANNWGDNGLSDTDKFSYTGNGIYQLEFTLTQGEQNFVISSADDSTTVLGFSDVDLATDSLTLTADAQDNMVLNAENTGNYQLTLDASQATPVLSIVSKNTTVNCEALPDSTDSIPFNIAGGGELYVRGDHSGWNAQEAYRLHYKGNNQYQAVASFDGAMQFKLASDDGSWSTQLWVREQSSDNIEGGSLALGINYPIAYENAGTDNNQTTLENGEYSFLLTLDSANPAKGFSVGSMVIQACER